MQTFQKGQQVLVVDSPYPIHVPNGTIGVIVHVRPDIGAVEVGVPPEVLGHGIDWFFRNPRRQLELCGIQPVPRPAPSVVAVVPPMSNSEWNERWRRVMNRYYKSFNFPALERFQHQFKPYHQRDPRGGR
jgi:hypothetical protein